MRHKILRTILRLLLSGGCFGFSFRAATTGYEKTQLTLMLSSIPVFLIGVLIIWTPLFALLTRPFTAMVDSLFFPGGKLDKPVLNLKLPAYLINEGRYSEALEEYRQILKHYPEEVEAYEKSIWLYQDIFNEPEKARRILRQAERRHLVLDERFKRLLSLREELDRLERKSN
ncbi:MAG: tetratricopeptide repeat protein [Verrucomicrobiales bacterium]|jgi:tetratricopeptide (TPR) repeat protein|nr:tetratricopeptide repeat protein [Verrucomicrobiales bacterium]